MRSDRIYSPAKVNEERFTYFLTTDEAIFTKLDRIIKQVEIYINL